MEGTCVAFFLTELALLVEFLENLVESQVNPLTRASFKKMVLSSTKWPFFSPIWSNFVPILAKSAFYHERLAFLSVSGCFLRACAQFKIVRVFYAKNSPISGSRLRFSAQSRCFRSHFDFCYQVIHTTTVPGDKKSLASKLIEKERVGQK